MVRWWEPDTSRNLKHVYQRSTVFLKLARNKDMLWPPPPTLQRLNLHIKHDSGGISFETATWAVGFACGSTGRARTAFGLMPIEMKACTVQETGRCRPGVVHNLNVCKFTSGVVHGVGGSNVGHRLHLLLSLKCVSCLRSAEEHRTQLDIRHN